MTNSGLGISDHYRCEMQTRFEELRLCEGGWKADQIAIDYYSSWRTARNKGGKFNVRVKQEEQDDSDGDDPDNDRLGDDKADLNPQKRKSTDEDTGTTSAKRSKEEPSRVKPCIKVLHAIYSWSLLTFHICRSKIPCTLPLRWSSHRSVEHCF